MTQRELALGGYLNPYLRVIVFTLTPALRAVWES
jgi:hypothetical protein